MFLAEGEGKMPFLLNLLKNRNLMIAGGVLLALVFAYFYIRHQAFSECENKQKVAVLEHTIERKKEYERIEKTLPYSRDRNAKFEWLFNSVYQ